MRINELILENDQLDEISLKGVGQAIGKGADIAGQAVGGAASGVVNTVKRFGQGLKKGWQGTANAMAGDDAAGATNTGGAPGTAPSAPASGGAPTSGATAAPATVGAEPAPATGGATAPAGGGTATAAPTPAASSSELDQLKATLGKLNPEQKKELAGELEKSMNTPAQQPAQPPAGGAAPAGGQSMEIDPAKAAADKQAKNAADAAERDAQIAATKQANATAAQADNDLVAAVKAAKAKPGFQQTAQDKLAIQQGAAKGIHESKKKKKKKVVAEFKSNFLGMVI